MSRKVGCLMGRVMIPSLFATFVARDGGRRFFVLDWISIDNLALWLPFHLPPSAPDWWVREPECLGQPQVLELGHLVSVRDGCDAEVTFD